MHRASVVGCWNQTSPLTRGWTGRHRITSSFSNRMSGQQPVTWLLTNRRTSTLKTAFLSPHLVSHVFLHLYLPPVWIHYCQWSQGHHFCKEGLLHLLPCPISSSRFPPTIAPSHPGIRSGFISIFKQTKYSRAILRISRTLLKNLGASCTSLKEWLWIDLSFIFEWGHCYLLRDYTFVQIEFDVSLMLSVLKIIFAYLLMSNIFIYFI